MGGSGGYVPNRPTPSFEEKRDELFARERERLTSNVKEYIERLLTAFNDRDEEQDRRRLDRLKEIIGKDADVEALLLGGSVAKHTAVDGVSDIDALVVLDRKDLQGENPKTILRLLKQILADGVDKQEVRSVRHGGLAVTVVYRDGREIQLLPAIRSGKNVQISTASRSSWKKIRPGKFAAKLTSANKKLDGTLVPAIKLMKAVNDNLPSPKKISGYHIEALAVDAVRSYRGTKSVKAVFERILEHSRSRVMRPIQDVTGQSRTVDDELGPANSSRRRNISQALASLHRRLAAATSVSDWRSIIEG